MRSVLLKHERALENYAEAQVRMESVCVLKGLSFCRYLCANTFLSRTRMGCELLRQSCIGESGAHGGSLLGGNTPKPPWLLPSRVEVPPHPEMEHCDLLMEKLSGPKPIP